MISAVDSPTDVGAMNNRAAGTPFQRAIQIGANLA